uniref:DUF1618 domain-containing protein n=1 Tax=Leersia perrieri TaxID=77586 RepID=A0A0D9XPM7_9ORYZ
MCLRKKWLLMEIRTSESCSVSLMKTQTTATAGGKYPRWIIIYKYSDLKNKNNNPSSSCVTAYAKTEATSLSSTGHTISLSFCFEEPPAVSRLCFHFSPYGGRHGSPSMYPITIHRNSMLLKMHHNDCHGGMGYFVYNAGVATADPPCPPSLWPIPTDQLRCMGRGRELQVKTTSLLHHGAGQNDFVVADLIVQERGMPKDQAELLVFRCGEWSVTQPSIIHGDGKADELLWWRTDMVVTVGERLK